MATRRKKTGPKRGANRTRKTKPGTVAEYLERVGKDRRAALQKLRQAIRAAAPAARECISYGIPSFRLKGKFLVAYAAAANHCSFYPGSAVQSLKKELKGYDIDKGTVRFSAQKPLPSVLVRKLVRLRMAKMKTGSE